MASSKRWNIKTKNLNSLPSHNTPKTLSKPLTYSPNLHNINNPPKIILKNTKFKANTKMINLNLINLPNNLYQTKPYKKTDNKSTNDPNSASRPFKN